MASKRKAEAVCVGITGTAALDNPLPGCAVARSLARLSKKPSLVGLSYSLHDPGNYMRSLFANSFLMPRPAKGWRITAAALKNVRKKSGMNVLLPCLDSELSDLVRHQGKLKSMGIRTLLPSKRQLDAREKIRLPELCRRVGVRHPRTEAVTSMKGLLRALKRFRLPVMIKGKRWAAHLVHSPEEALLKAAELVSGSGFPILIQERINGTPLTLAGLCDASGRVMGSVSIKKLLTTVRGTTWAAVTVSEPELDGLRDRFARFTRWRGPFELECILSERGLTLIEINPRFPSWIFFGTAAGVNLPGMLLDLIVRGKCDPAPEYALGKHLVRCTTEFAGNRSDFANLFKTGNRLGI